MNRCAICGRKLKNSETTCGVEFCKVYERYEQQLAEKDIKINKLSEEHFEMFGDMKDYKNLWLAEQRKNKEIRKQVCDEIGEKIEKRIEAYPIICEDENGIVRRCVFLDNIKDILDQIEKGEQVRKN